MTDVHTPEKNLLHFMRTTIGTVVGVLSVAGRGLMVPAVDHGPTEVNDARAFQAP
jgi:hypothetical protein